MSGEFATVLRRFTSEITRPWESPDDLIVLVRNAAPELLAVLKAAREQVAGTYAFEGGPTVPAFQLEEALDALDAKVRS